MEGGTFKNEVMETLGACLVFIDILESMQKEIKAAKKREISSKILSHIKKEKEDLQKIDNIGFEYDKNVFISKYIKSISHLAKDIFKTRLSNDVCGSIAELCYDHFIKKSTSEFFTGIVIAGFGSDELFPSIEHYIVDGKDENATRIWAVNERNFNKELRLPALIVAYAQSDIMHVFMEGIIPNFLSYISRYLKKALDDKSQALIDDYIADDDEKIVEIARQKKDNMIAVQEFSEGFKKYREKALINPVLNVVQSLPKEEMAAMAEALVELTALRRKVDSHLETVGGPTDVAVISKGDGFIWIKRKHYFEAVQNPDFVLRKKRLLDGGESD